jgi:hypothetical protein
MVAQVAGNYHASDSGSSGVVGAIPQHISLLLQLEDERVVSLHFLLQVDVATQREDSKILTRLQPCCVARPSSNIPSNASCTSHWGLRASLMPLLWKWVRADCSLVQEEGEDDKAKKEADTWQAHIDRSGNLLGVV